MAGEPITSMEQMVSLEYEIRPSPLAVEYGEKLRQGRITGHRCPQCELVQTPPTGFCSICAMRASWYSPILKK